MVISKEDGGKAVSVRKGTEFKNDKFKRKSTLTADRLRQIIPKVINKNRRRDFASRLRTLNKQERTRKRRSRQAAEARGETVEKGLPHSIETLRRPDETIG